MNPYETMVIYAILDAIRLYRKGDKEGEEFLFTDSLYNFLDFWDLPFFRGQSAVKMVRALAKSKKDIKQLREQLLGVGDEL